MTPPGKSLLSEQKKGALALAIINTYARACTIVAVGTLLQTSTIVLLKGHTALNLLVAFDFSLK